MISAGLISLLVIGLACYMYVPLFDSDGQERTFTGAGIQSQIANLFGYLHDMFGVGNTGEGSTKVKPKDGIMTTYEEIDGVGALIHRPVSSADGMSLPSIIYMHGGGWTSGSTEEYREFTLHLSKVSGNNVISIEYRLSPEFRFPIPFEDCLRATMFLLRNPEMFGMSADKITLAGDDVGGNLALSVALNITKDEPKLAAKLRMIGLFYSPLQAFDFNLPSYTKYTCTGRQGIMCKEDIVKQFSYYLFGDANDTIVTILMNNLHTSSELKNSKLADIFDLNLLPFSFREYLEPGSNIQAENEQLSKEILQLILDIRVSPMLAPMDDLKRLPFTYFIAPEVDPLRDESFMFYGTLREIDINKNEHDYYRSEKHGFLKDFRDNEIAKTAISRFIKHLKRTLFTPKKRLKLTTVN